MKKSTKIVFLVLILWFVQIIILGAYFKLTHIPGANFMLAIGLGAEALIFLLAVVFEAVCKKKQK